MSFISPDALNFKEELEMKRSVMLQLIEDCESKIATYKRELNIIDFALASGFYKETKSDDIANSGFTKQDFDLENHFASGL